MEAKQAAEKLNKSKPSCMIREYILSQTDDKTVRRVWKKSAENLADIYSKYPDIPKDEQMHTKGIFNTAAIYFHSKQLRPIKPWVLSRAVWQPTQKMRRGHISEWCVSLLEKLSL